MNKTYKYQIKLWILDFSVNKPDDIEFDFLERITDIQYFPSNIYEYLMKSSERSTDIFGVKTIEEGKIFLLNSQEHNDLFQIEEIINKLNFKLQDPNLPNYIRDEYKYQLAFYNKKLVNFNNFYIF